MGYHDGMQHRHQPARRAGAVVRQLGTRRAQAEAVFVTVVAGETLDQHASLPPDATSAGPPVSPAGRTPVQDGYSDLMIVIKPVWQSEFGLGYTELGLLRGVFACPWRRF